MINRRNKKKTLRSAQGFRNSRNATLVKHISKEEFENPGSATTMTLNNTSSIFDLSLNQNVMAASIENFKLGRITKKRIGRN